MIAGQKSNATSSLPDLARRHTQHNTHITEAMRYGIELEGGATWNALTKVHGHGMWRCVWGEGVYLTKGNMGSGRTMACIVFSQLHFDWLTLTFVSESTVAMYATVIAETGAVVRSERVGLVLHPFHGGILGGTPDRK